MLKDVELMLIREQEDGSWKYPILNKEGSETKASEMII